MARDDYILYLPRIQDTFSIGFALHRTKEKQAQNYHGKKNQKRINHCSNQEKMKWQGEPQENQLSQ